MEHVILVIHLIVTVLMIVLILLQRSEGGGLGLGSSGGLGNFASAQSTGNALTKATTYVAFIFFTTSIVLAIMASRGGDHASSILDEASKDVPAITEPAKPAEPPIVPIAK
jgi:preprotein translocase subunit SecG